MLVPPRPQLLGGERGAVGVPEMGVGETVGIAHPHGRRPVPGVERRLDAVVGELGGERQVAGGDLEHGQVALRYGRWNSMPERTVIA